jgi:hypothetical protein
LPFQGEWATCEYNRVHDRLHNRKIAEDRNDETKFLTPELEALWVKTEAAFAKRDPQCDDEELAELLAKMDAEASPAKCHGWHDTVSAFVPRVALRPFMTPGTPGKFRK